MFIHFHIICNSYYPRYLEKIIFNMNYVHYLNQRYNYCFYVLISCRRTHIILCMLDTPYPYELVHYITR